MPRSQSSTPVEGEPNTASDEESIFSALSLAARIESFNEEAQRLRQLLRPSALHSQENEEDRLLAQFRPMTEQNQARNSDTASVPLIGGLLTPASPTLSDLASYSEDAIAFMDMDPRELMDLQPNASAHLPSLGIARSSPSVANLDASPALAPHQGASEGESIDDRAPIYYNIPGSWSPEPFGSGALAAFHLSHGVRPSNTQLVDQLLHREELGELERGFAIQWPQESLLRDMSQSPSQERDRQSFEVMPAMIPTNNSDSESVLLQLIPSLHFYPNSGSRRYTSSPSHQEFSAFANTPYRPEDSLNRPALESGAGEINQFAGTGSSTADRDIADVNGAMVEHVEDTRNHRLVRYYELMEAYSYILRRWCQHVHHQVINHAHHGIRIPRSSLERMPTIHSTFWDIGRHLLSQDHHRIATAAQRIQNFLLRWSENRGPAHRIWQSIEEVPLLEQFAQLLLQEGMEQERMVWEPVVQLHTGRRLTALILAYEHARFVSLQRNNATTLDDEDESVINMDVVDGISPYRYFG
jgi:hypothetical protein